MKKIIFLSLILAAVSIKVEAQKDANLRIMNLQCWWDSYDPKTMTVKNVNIMVGADGDNSKDKTGSCKIAIYIYNKEQYEATKELIIVKTYESEYISHMGTREWKNQNIKLSGFGLVPGVYRLGVWVDSDKEITEPNENDNAGLIEGEIIIKEGQTEPATTTTTNPNNPSNPTNPTDPNTTNTTPVEKPVDPNQVYIDEKLKNESELTEYTKKITTLEFEMSEKKKTNALDPVEEKITKFEIEELKYRSEERKNAIERLSKTIDKSITPTQSQNYIAKEQEYLLKANSVQKSKNELIALRDERNKFQKSSTDQAAFISQAELDLPNMPRSNKLDSLNYDIKKNQIQENKYRLAASNAGLERTTKTLNGTITADEKTKLQAIENDNNHQANNILTTINDLNKQKKAEEKAIKKEQRGDKVDNAKLKVKIKLVKNEISSKEKDLAKAKAKKKPNAEDIAKKEQELNDAKAKLKEYESQLK